MPDPFGVIDRLDLGGGAGPRFWSLPRLARAGFPGLARLPVSLRVVLESLLRNLDGQRVREADVAALAAWRPGAERTAEIPFVVSRVLLQDFTGVPLLVDLAAMRTAAVRRGLDPGRIEPVVPVDLVVDHSVQVDAWGTAEALAVNQARELTRNRQRYEFLKWGAQAFRTFRIVPPGVGICHQVNLESLAGVVWERDGAALFDTLVGTDSHTTMVNGLGVLGWGVGGIEAEAAMLGEPTAFLTPEVVGCHLHGALREGVTATDLVLTVTEALRRAKVVGKLVEFHGAGARALTAATRATVANMAPEYGATAGLFPVDEQTLVYLGATGRSAEQVRLVRSYCEAQGVFGIPLAGACDYSQVIEVDLSAVEPSVAGPKRPQDRIPLASLEARFEELLGRTDAAGFGRPRATRNAAAGAGGAGAPAEGPPLADGDVVIAAITSCTNTSNPSVMLAAGLLARKAAARGLRPRPWVKTSLAPGSRLVSDYLARTGLQADLDTLGFQTVGYGCTTCIGNSGPLDPRIEARVASGDLVVASVLSGNRNFEARVHPAVRANFLMSPPLVVAFALAGRIGIDLEREPLGRGADGGEVYLRDVWPSDTEVEALLGKAAAPERARRNYEDLAAGNPGWAALPAPAGQTFTWDPDSGYVREPPWFLPFPESPEPAPPVRGARALAVLGDSVTTDHISPAGAIEPDSPAGRWLRSQGVTVADFNSYGARRGNHEVMVRGTFANVRLRNLLVPGAEGGVAVHQPSGERMSIFEAAARYAAEGVPLVVLAGLEYGTGSSRDWAAKGTRLLGVRAVIARSFERIHRANLVGMGVLPLQLPEGVTPQGLALDGSEQLDVELPAGAAPRQPASLVVRRTGGRSDPVALTLRIDTPAEAEHFRHGGILPWVLRRIAREGSAR